MFEGSYSDSPSFTAQAAAVVLSPGDVLSAAATDSNMSQISIVRIDRTTGDRTVVSGPTRGAGPQIVRNSNRDIGLVYSNGMIYASWSGGARYYRIDPATGDREIFSGCTASGYPCQDPLIGSGPEVSNTWALIAVGAVPPTLAGPPWWATVLLAGVVIGLTIRTVRIPARRDTCPRPSLVALG
jgi:hypothetical protein